MDYRRVAIASKILLVAVTVFVGLLIFLPRISYMMKPEMDIVMGLEADERETFSWLNERYKLSKNLNKEIPDILVINSPEAFILNEDLNIDHNMVILEGLFSQLTENPYAMERVNSLANVDFTGFSGKTYQDLAELDVIPEKIIERYEVENGRQWEFYGEGIIISDEQHIIVLIQGEDYDGTMNIEFQNKKMPFYEYFELTRSSEEMLAQFDLDLTDEGKEKLSQLGIAFPYGSIYQLDRNFFKGYYMAGTFLEMGLEVSPKYDLIEPFMKNKIIYEKYTGEEPFWKVTIPLFNDAIEMAKKGFEIKATEQNEKFYIEEKTIFIENELGGIKPFFMKGVNLGAALPGKFFTEFPMEKETYLKWLEQMSKLNVNSVRVYTLLPPNFYQALYEYNRNTEQPIYLLQEIWPEEHPKDLNYLGEEYNDVYEQEIEYAVHAIHGNIKIPVRDYRAHGLYAYDVSPYLLGYLVGREMEPEEVLATDEMNNGYLFKGEYIYSEPEASPTESWLAQSCNYALKIEESIYGNKPLTAIVSWPTLDPAEHDSEWNISDDKALQFNDKAVVDIDNIGVNKERINGFFGAYHIYPNYPNFMNNEKKYAEYEDGQGIFRYGGYLEEFMSQHDKYPAIVAEYGISTSSNMAHFNPDGLHHGGLNESNQGDDIIRMTEAIRKEKYSGAIIFEWMDEWAKKTWTTEFYMIPYERQVLWHNALDPEQNYGILANESIEPSYEEVSFITEIESPIKKIKYGQNMAYLFIQFELEDDINNNERLDILLDTVVKKETETAWEFFLSVDEKARLKVNPYYNWVEGRYMSKPVDVKNFIEMNQLVNPENIAKDGTFTAEKSINLSELGIGTFDKLQNNVWIDGNKITIRIPYGLIGISDPSSAQALWDENIFVPMERDKIKTVSIEKIGIKIVGDENIQFDIPLETWESPQYVQRLKDSFYVLGEYFKHLHTN